MGRAEWKRVLKASRAAGAPYAARLAELLPALLEIEEILTPMRPVQPATWTCGPTTCDAATAARS